MYKLVNGSKYIFSGAKLLIHRRILPFVAVPIALNVGLFYWAFSVVFGGFDAWLTEWMANIPDFLNFIGGVLRVLFIMATLLLAAFSFTLVANFIGSPFYGLMAEQVSKINHHSTTQPPLTFSFIFSLVRRTLWRETQKLIYYSVRVVALLVIWAILSFTPFAVIMPFIWLWFGAKMMVIQYVDYGYDNDGLPFNQLKQDLKHDRWTALGFGSVATLASMVPLLNIFAVPASVCGGTLYYVEKFAAAANSIDTKKQIK